MNIQKSELHTQNAKKKASNISVDKNEYKKYLESEAWLSKLLKDIEKVSID